MDKDIAPSSAEVVIQADDEEMPQDSPLGRVLLAVDPPPPPKLQPGLNIVRVHRIEPPRAEIEAFTTTREALCWVDVHETVDIPFLQSAMSEGQFALVQNNSRGAVLVGVVQTRTPRHQLVGSDDLEIVAGNQITLRTGRAALRLKSDGAIELLGTRITATSRGVLRLLGRALRLN